MTGSSPSENEKESLQTEWVKSNSERHEKKEKKKVRTEPETFLRFAHESMRIQSSSVSIAQIFFLSLWKFVEISLRKRSIPIFSPFFGRLLCSVSSVVSFLVRMPSRRHRLETIVLSVVFLFFLFSITLDRAESSFVVNDDLIRQVNENPHATWKVWYHFVCLCENFLLRDSVWSVVRRKM